MGKDCDELPSLPDLRVRVIRNQPYGAAILEGLHSSTTTYVATMDADGQHQFRDVHRLYDEVEGYDLDMGIGLRPKRGSRAMPSHLLNLAASILAGRHVPDLGCGARVFRRDMALELAPRLPEGFDFNAVLTTLAIARGYRVEWVKIPHRPRQRGQSHVRWQDGPRTLKSLLRVATHE